MIKCRIANASECGETCCCIDCEKVESCKNICTYVDEAEICKGAIRESRFSTYYMVETTTHIDESVHSGVSMVRSNIRPANFKGSFLGCNVEYRYFDTEAEAQKYKEKQEKSTKRINEAGYLAVSDLFEYFCIINDFLEFVAIRLGIEPDSVKRRFCEDTLNSIESGVSEE